ncbi:MAG: hypothetical protein O7G83_22025 [Proteobacteria bacterium]|nr:hypothetical protein [Pseudomonadota bacterium]
MDTVDKILDILFGPGINSDTRLPVMLRRLLREPPAVFWPVFLDAWPNCDATWELRSDLLYLLRRASASEPSRGYFDPDTLAFYDELPDPATIYRGCSHARVRGVSWTTDRDSAATFAHGHRSIPVPDPVVAQATMPKEAVFAVFTERNESEVLVDPRRLGNLQIKPFQEAAGSRDSN